MNVISKLALSGMLFPCLLVSVACDPGKVPWCSTPCPAGFDRDLTCNCQKRSTTPEPPPVQNGAISASCICEWPGGQYEAWLRGRPSNFSQLPGKSTQVQASSCENVNNCPILGAKDLRRFFTGTMSMDVSTANTRENLVTGRTFYTLMGKASSNAKLKEPAQPAVALQVKNAVEFLGLTASLNMVAFPSPPAQAGAANSCLSLCPSNNLNASCAFVPVDSQVRGALGQILVEAQDRSSFTLDADDMRRRFGVREDPCDRGPSAITEAGVTNIGPPCTVDARSQSLGVRLRVEVPGRLEGTWVQRQVFPMRLAFAVNNDTEDALRVRFLEMESDRPAPLDADFGGVVSFAEADASRLFVRTAGGCIGVGLAR